MRIGISGRDDVTDVFFIIYSHLLTRSASDASINSHEGYIRALNPSPFEIIAWQMDRQRYVDHEHQANTVRNCERHRDRMPPYSPIGNGYVTCDSHYTYLEGPPRSRRLSQGYIHFSDRF